MVVVVVVVLRGVEHVRSNGRAVITTHPTSITIVTIVYTPVSWLSWPQAGPIRIILPRWHEYFWVRHSKMIRRGVATTNRSRLRCGDTIFVGVGVACLAVVHPLEQGPLTRSELLIAIIVSDDIIVDGGVRQRNRIPFARVQK